MDYLRQQRIYKAFIVFMLLISLILYRLYDVQIGTHERYANKMLDQDTMSVSLEEYNRGIIYDRNLQPLTNAVQKERIIVFPSLMLDKAPVIMRLVKILGVEKSKVEKEIKDSPHYLSFEISSEQAIEIKNANLNGVKVAPVTLRYSHPPLAVHTLGYLGPIDNRELDKYNTTAKTYKLNDLVGKAGLEQTYEQELKGTRPEKVMRAYVDGNGNLIPGLGYKVEQNDLDITRHNLVLTIDKRVQEAVEKVMDSKVKKGTVIVMDPATGDILAMAGRPAYDTVQLDKYSQIKGVFLNQATQLYSPGSVFKIVVAAAALEEGKVTPETAFFCAGAKDKLIRCHLAVGHGNLNFAQAMAISCNPTFAKVGAIMLGAPKMIEYAQKMGMSNQSIIGYPFAADKRQNLKLIDSPENIVNSTVGQGPVLANPIQITAMINVIANKGIYREPRLVKELRSSNGKVVKRFSIDKGKQAISEKTAKQINDMLIKAVKEGTGKEADISQGSAGKTGTAEVDVKNGIKNAWFTGYAPINKPEYIVTILLPDLKNPADNGGSSAGPIFKEIMTELLKLD